MPLFMIKLIYTMYLQLRHVFSEIIVTHCYLPSEGLQVSFYYFIFPFTIPSQHTGVCLVQRDLSKILKCCFRDGVVGVIFVHTWCTASSLY